jgi:uncharacterized membrane-anchored protein YhcB (DUF1043 family)
MKEPKKLIELGIALVVGFLLGFLIANWDSTKKAAIDAWEGEYDPPKESIN